MYGLPVVFMFDATVDRSNKMNSELYMAIFSDQIQPNTAKLHPYG